MEENNIVASKIKFDMKCYLNKFPTDALLDELKRLCSKKEEKLTYLDIEEIYVICQILVEREEDEYGRN